MLSNPKTKGPVKIAKETATTWSPKNLHAVDNVNVAQGPRTGNHGEPAKRGKFNSAKAEREPLATVIERAYAKRQHEYEDYEYTNGGSIMDNVNEGKRKK